MSPPSPPPTPTASAVNAAFAERSMSKLGPDVLHGNGREANLEEEDDDDDDEDEDDDVDDPDISMFTTALPATLFASFFSEVAIE